MISCWTLIISYIILAIFFLIIFIYQANKVEKGIKDSFNIGYYLIPVFGSFVMIFIILLLSDYVPYKFNKEFPIKFDGKVYYAIDTDTNEILNPQEFTKEKINESMKVYKYLRDNKLSFIKYEHLTGLIKYEAR